MKAYDACDGERDVSALSDQWKKEALHLLRLPSTYAGLLLLVIAITLMYLPDITSNTKDFLMVAFACIAMLPEKNPLL
jgi:hypothetical protein